MTDKPTLDQLLAEFDEAVTDFGDYIYFEGDPKRSNGTSPDDLREFVKQAYQAGRESVLDNKSNRRK